MPEEDLAPGDAGGVRVLLAYFLGEGRGDGEQVRFALSADESLRKWRDLPGSIPSPVGEGGIRDPFVLRDAGRRRFVLLGTNLRGWPQDDWKRAVTRGSRSILISESSDLVSWSTPRLVPLAPETAGNAWAPKAFWDSERASWRLFWASALYPAGPRRHDTSYQRILTSTTQDFVSFSEPRVSIDLGYSVIDATFFVYEGRWFRLTVRHPDRSVPTFVTLEVGSSLLDEDFRIVATDIGEGVLAQGEGPAPAVSSDGTVRLLVDEFLGGGYHVFEITDPLRGTWRPVPDAALPVGARHGSLLALSARESHRLGRRTL